MTSAAFSIAGGASLIKASVAAGATVALALDSTDGVSTVAWSVKLADGLSEVADWTIADPTATSTTITAPNVEGVACIVQCLVNGGRTFSPVNGRQVVGDLVKTAKVYVETADGLEVICAGETTESDPTYGLFVPVNAKIRQSGGGGGAFDPLAATVNIATSTTTALNIGRAAATVAIDADALTETVANDYGIIAGGFDVASSGAVDIAAGAGATLSGATSTALGISSSPTTLAGSTVAVTSAGDLDITGTTPSMTGSTSSHVLGPTCVVGVSATGVRVEVDSDAGKSRARLYDGSNVLGLSLRTDGAAAYVEGVGATTLSGLTLVVTDDDGTVMTADGAGSCVFGGSGKTPTVTGGTVTCGGTTATNLGTSAGSTTTVGNATGTLSVNAATYNTACTTFSTYAIGTMTLQAYGTSLNLQCNSYLMNQGPVAGTARIQDRYPVAVTPGSAAATPIGTVTVPASSSGEWYGTIDLRNGSTNHEVYDVWFLWNSDGTTVASRDLTVTVKGTTQGTIATVVGDVTRGDAGLIVTISAANASGIKCALTGRARINP